MNTETALCLPFFARVVFSMGIWLTQVSHTVVLHSRSTSRPTTRTSQPRTPSSIPSSTRRSNQASRKVTLHNQRVRSIWCRSYDDHMQACNHSCRCACIVVLMTAVARHRRCHRLYFTSHKMIRSFALSFTLLSPTIQNVLTKNHTGPSGTVKLAKKEPAPRPAGASKEKKPAAKVHRLRPN